MLELDDFRGNYSVKVKIKTVLREANPKRRQAEGLKPKHLQAALAAFNPDVPRDHQDMVLLFVGFETLCRREELVRFDWGDLSLEDGIALLHLTSSKTDQEGKGSYLALSANTRDMLLAWQARCQMKQGAIFRGIDSGNRLTERLQPQGVLRAFKRIAKRLDLDPQRFSGHSTRVGAAQTMVEMNVETSKILLSGRWKTLQMLTQYAEKIEAKRSGAVEMMQRVWQSSASGKITQEQELPFLEDKYDKPKV